MATKLYRTVRNLRLKSRGISHCAHCKNCWGVVQGYDIPFAPGRAMFPVCTECFPKLDADQVIAYCNELVDVWFTQGLHGEDSFEIRRDVAESVRQLKRPPVL
ncbi:hypothetical protein HYV30_03155 [Candidatus Kaiserbacteria bacterium]|nr:hypothetical protein [Candidatus Kaiserbacteria bacterium]